MSITDWIGCLGGVFLLGAYLLNSTGRIKRRSIAYQAMNFFGAGGISVNVFAEKAWPTFVVEAIWTLSAVVLLWSVFREKNAPREKS
jgi:prolipoprotein diacylglyceryltransferase